MAKLRTASEVNKLVKKGTPTLASVDKCLAIEVKSKGVAIWQMRFQLNKRRHQLKLGVYSTFDNNLMTYYEAKKIAATYSEVLLNGDNPIIEIAKNKQADIQTVNELFNQYHKSECYNSKYTTAICRIYNKEIKPFIGSLKPSKVIKTDLEKVLATIVFSKRKSIAHKTLYLCKNLFSYAAEHNISNYNVATSLSIKKHAGGASKPRKHVLMSREIESMFKVFSSDQHRMSEQTFIGIVLLLILGLRKMELFSAEWSDFDWTESTFYLFEDDTKTAEALAIPLPNSILPLLQRLKVLSINSNYLFPARIRNSKSGHISESTLNRSIKAFFRDGSCSQKSSLQYLNDHNVDYFIPHDLRRTFRTRIAKLGINREVAEMSLNHRKSCIEKTYNLHEYYYERLEAHELMANEILPLAGYKYIDNPTIITNIAA